MFMVLVVDQAALYTRTSPVTYAKGNSSIYLKDIFNREEPELQRYFAERSIFRLNQLRKRAPSLRESCR